MYVYINNGSDANGRLNVFIGWPGATSTRDVNVRVIGCGDVTHAGGGGRAGSARGLLCPGRRERRTCFCVEAGLWQ